MNTPRIRIEDANLLPAREDGDYVLYWMIGSRRITWNFALQRAVEWAEKLRKPLLIFEPLRVDYRWACDRFHRFVLDGMADTAGRLEKLQRPGVVYYPYLERCRGEDHGLLMTLAKNASVVVTDDYPAFFLPAMVRRVAKELPVKLEVVDSNGLLPLRVTDRVFSTAFSFRAYLQKELPKHLEAVPLAEPLAQVNLPPFRQFPSSLTRRWPMVTPAMWQESQDSLKDLPINHAIAPVAQRGGNSAAEVRLQGFLTRSLDRYGDDANHPDAEARSGLSPYLHFGHISVHQIFAQLMRLENWTLDCLGSKTAGKREGWWGVRPSAESWLDELVTWRELGYNFSAHAPVGQRYESLPAWSRATLAKHAMDHRPHCYSLQAFADAATHDSLWNAAQVQLLREGIIHNYLRMYWGKKILEWSESPQAALHTMIELNNRYALDGRDPNSYSGIFWVLGRYDRPWGPERPIFGTVRYMSGDSTRKKLRLKQYLAKFGRE